MAKSNAIKPSHKAIQQYHQSLKDYRGVGVKHEGAVETAFQRLLEHVAKLNHCQLIPKHKLKVGAQLIYPDGTVFEKELGDLGLRLGYWEAKDIDDDLDKAIASKVASKYPLNNTIFENTRKAVLFQGGKARDQFDLADKKQLADLLNEFFAYHEPEIANFHDAIAEFKERVPDLAKGLVAILNEAHKKNTDFIAAFASFLTVCQQTLNPNISRAAVDEMLVQHLLTERLIRKIFDNPEFMKRNVIAAEIEKVIDALVSHSFNRDQFLRSLDRFYRAIEEAAQTLEDFAEKQHFLNTVYERFFQGYSVKVADTHGIVYTPQEIVDFMCASVEEVLQKEFNLTLGSKGVNILDPCTGTGNFIVNLINRIPKKDLPRVYKEQLFANEVMLLPYYIAALNIEHAYWERTGTYEAFEGLCFADTLDMTEDEYVSLFTEENTARIRRQKKTPITVVIGNPPYNIGQLDENDKNKNRKYTALDGRLTRSYVEDATSTLRMQLYDPYVRFFRWAADRLGGRDGIVCYVSNNSFVDQLAFDGMRKHLRQDFGLFYHLDLHGNVRRNPKLSGTTHNVFGIQVGVGITIAVQLASKKGPVLHYHRVPENWRKEEKLGFLKSSVSVAGVNWQRIEPDERNNWIAIAHQNEFGAFAPMGSKAAKGVGGGSEKVVFSLFSSGVKTNSDVYLYDFSPDALGDRAQRMVEDFNGALDLWVRKGKPRELGGILRIDEKVLKWIRNTKRTLMRGEYVNFDPAKIRRGVYRPFVRQYYYFERAFNEDVYRFPQILPTPESELENCIIAVTNHSQIDFAVQIMTSLPCLDVGGRPSQCFPFYTYDKNTSNRRENITAWALEQFRTHYGDAKIGKWDIFYYVYGLLHHPGYRTKFADNLKRELPRIPSRRRCPRSLTVAARREKTRENEKLNEPRPSGSGFWAFADAGRELAKLHLEYEKLEPWALAWIETEGVPLSYRVEDKMRLTKDKTSLRVNPSLTLAGIPPAVFDYRLGNRSALDWVIDQYQVSEDKRSGIRSDPNRADDPEYIVRLVGQVVRVSMETVRIVNGLPAAFA